MYKGTLMLIIVFLVDCAILLKRNELMNMMGIKETHIMSAFFRSTCHTAELTIGIFLV